MKLEIFMLNEFNALFRSSDLLWTWTGRNIRARYQQSLMGGLWIVAQPVATVIVFSVIFTLFVPIDTGEIPYPVFSYVAIVPWMLLSSSLTDMASSLVSNMSLVTKIYFRREILPLAAMLARLLDFLVAGVILFVLMFVYRMQINPASLLALPAVIIIQLALIVGLGLFLAAANTFYRDIGPSLALGIQLWFYASPIIYPVSMVPENLRTFYFLNPMAGVLIAYREILLFGRLPGVYLIPAIVIAAIVLVIGYWFFRHVEFRIADIV
jgi:lipopolysaccharide transport system permease protein